jgi:hypothetical protein
MPVRAKKLRAKKSRPTAKGRVLGAKAFAAISAVEGLKMSAASKKRFRTFKSRGLTPDEQRAEILRVYRQIDGRK